MQVDRQLVVLHFFDAGVVARAAAAQHGFDPRDDLFGVKRLHHIVVRTQFQTEHLVEHFAFGGEHDDRALGLFADFAANLPAVQLREHNVQHNQVGLLGAEHFQRAFAVVGNHHLKAVFFDVQPQQFANILVVVHHKDFAV